MISGDRITVINENSLENMSRHDAVEIVRSSPQNLIHLEVMRLRSLYSSDESLAVGTAELPNGKAQTLPPNAVLSDMNAEPNLSFQTQSRTLPTEMPVSTSTDNIGIMGKFTADPSSNSPGINFSPRTHLHNEFRPADTSIFNVDSFSPGRRPPSPAPTTTSTPKHAAINNLLFGSLAKTSSASLISQSPAILAQPPSIYGGLEHSSDEDEDEIDGNGHTDAADQFRGASSYHLQSDSDLDTGEIRTNDFASKKSIDVHDHNGGPRNDNVLDWTDEIDMADINQIDMLDDSIEVKLMQSNI